MIEILSNIIMYELFFFAVVTFDYFFLCHIAFKTNKEKKIRTQAIQQKTKN